MKQTFTTRIAAGIAFLIVGVTCANARVHAASPPQVSFRTLQTPQGAHQFQLSQSWNDNGEKEVVIAHQEVRRFLPDSSLVVLWGRDLNADQKYDAWFYYDEDGVIQAVEGRARESDGWDAASRVLSQRVDVGNRWYPQVLFGSILSVLSFTKSNQNQAFARITRAQINLRDLEIRSNRIFAKDQAAPGLGMQYSLVSSGWEHLAQTGISQELRQNFAYAGADLAAYLSGYAIARGLGAAFSWIGGKITAAGAGQFADELFARFATRIGTTAQEINEKYLVRRGSSTVKGAAISAAQAAKSLVLNASQKVDLTIRALESQSRLAHVVAEGARTSVNVSKSGLKEWRYIGMTQFIQLGAETWNRRDTLFADGAIYYPGKVLSNKDMIQNMSYMTSETFLLASVSSYSPNVFRRMMVCGFLSFVNSNANALLIKGETDKSRIALDTGWEVVIGNIQTQIDIGALQYFNQLSQGGPSHYMSVTGKELAKFGTVGQKAANPKIRLLGYAIALVDQSVGYLSYGKVTKNYEESKKSEGVKSAEAEFMKDFNPKELKLVPIYGLAAAD